MKISVELTLTPLADAYAPAIKDFIMRLRSSSFDLRETPLSTQIYGEYDVLMPFLTQEIKTTFESRPLGCQLRHDLGSGGKGTYMGLSNTKWQSPPCLQAQTTANARKLFQWN